VSLIDRLLGEAQHALGVLGGLTPGARPSPAAADPAETELAPAEKSRAAALMRVNHVGEVCAQALYRGQMAAAADAEPRALFATAAAEETDHLAWTAERVHQLGGRLSVLNPLWYAGSFALGYASGRLGDRWSLGFMAETEKQVERHLASHLDRLPAADAPSRRIVEQMKEEEMRHGAAASAAGGVPLPLPARLAMRSMAKLMTSTAYYL
jgi:ubiquinone biosynthesis monooxygenase Coq7